MHCSRGRTAALLCALAGLAFAAPGPVPAPWTAQDVGGPMAGNSTYDPAPTPPVWSITGSGGDIWGASDQFHYASLPITGDFIVTAHVASLTSTALDGWAKAGVMARDSNAANSMYAFEHWTGNNGTDYQFRTTNGGGAGSSGQSGTGNNHQWVRMARTGDSFQGSWSDDGAAWTAHGGAQTIDMGATILVGLAVTSHNNAVTATAVFDNVIVTDANGGMYWPLQPPTNLTATPGPNSVALGWTASAGATSYTVLRSQTAGGPYAALPGGTTAGTTFADTTATFPNTYYYVATATQTGVGTSATSNQATGIPQQPWVTATPNTGLQTNEAGTVTATFNVTFNQPAPLAGSQVTVTSSNPAEGLLSTPSSPTPAAGKVVTVTNGFIGSIPFTVHGIDDSVMDGPVSYAITVTATNAGPPIPDVNVTNTDNDQAGITVSRTAGLLTSEGLTTDSFTVSLNTQPTAPVTMTLSSSNPAEGTVSPTSITFNPAAGGVNGWNVAQVVTLTGVDDPALDFTVGYTIVTSTLSSGDSNYNTMPVTDVAAANLDNEAIPELPPVWGDGGGGCGLTGLEAVLLLALCRRIRRGRR